MPQKTDAVIAELMDRRLLNDVDPDLHQEIAKAVVKAVHTASLEGDAVERVAAVIRRAMLDNPTGGTSEERAAKRKAIAAEYAAAYVADLATGLVPDEAAIRADEREKCAKVADEHSFGLDIDWWLGATKKDVSAETCRSVAAAIRSGGGE